MKSALLTSTALVMLTAGVEANNGVATWKTQVKDSWGNSKQCAGGTKHFPTVTKSSKTKCRNYAYDMINADKDGTQSVTGNQDKFCVQYNENEGQELQGLRHPPARGLRQCQC